MNRSDPYKSKWWEVVMGWTLVLLVVLFIGGCIAVAVNEPTVQERRQECRDNGGIIKEDAWGYYIGCDIP